jgi:uncharacterized repeat protein (TIGR02543 family)
VEFGTGITLKDKPELSGYTFSGWMLSGATLDDTATSFTMPDNDVKLI